MERIIEFISQPWHWSVSGIVIVGVMLLLLGFGGEFGVSSNLRTMCTIGGAGKKINFFNIDWKKQAWNLVFIGGAVIGGFIAINFLSVDQGVQISESTHTYLKEVGIQHSYERGGWQGFLPAEIFVEVGSLKSLSILIVGGFLVGFGARYAGGCTSGHAISGLSNLQLPSLIAVVGFFTGGLIFTWLLLPLIF